MNVQKVRGKSLKEYIVYDNRTDEMLATGTAQECAKQLGYKSVNVFYSQLCSFKNRNNPKYSKRNSHLDIYDCDDLESEDDEE